MQRQGAWTRQDGNQLIEFLGLFPLLIMLGMVIFQLVLAFQTISVAASAAREAARAAAVCEDYQTAARNASLGYDGNREVSVVGGEMTSATVRLRVPTLKIIYLDSVMPWITSKAAVRTEQTRCY
jgi:hypothetical protein